uniref:Uncharacterized protein n=1 Tax=Borely moumouvirus TaxID=2712067 RepID=A0A6G6AAH7_9VIRU
MCPILSYYQKNNTIVEYRYNLFKRARLVNKNIKQMNSLYLNTAYQNYNACGYLI